MTPATEQDKPESQPLFLCAVNDRATILCERHAQVFELSMTMAQVPHTIYELDDEDSENANCQACDLQDELTRPRFILPN